MRKLVLVLALVIGLSFALAGCEEQGTTGAGGGASVERPSGGQEGLPPGERGQQPEPELPPGGKPADDVDPAGPPPGSGDEGSATE
jgi:hypothetical protein